MTELTETDSSVDRKERLIAERYRLESQLAGGAQAEAFRGIDTETDTEVFVKRVVVDEIDDWKSVELFERESEVLEKLDHPAIPAFVDAFHTPTDEGGEQFVLVQQFVDGSNLEELVEEGERFTEDQLRDFAGQILEILVDLHGRQPPVIHRDIKPSNVMRRADGRYVLVDFGTVRVAATETTGDSTTVGTVGYTPFEQLAGQVQPASDLYALGATLIHLASRVHPGELPTDGMALEFRDRVGIDDAFCQYIERLVAPRPAGRFDSADQALEALRRLGESGESVDTEAGFEPEDRGGGLVDAQTGNRPSEDLTAMGRHVEQNDEIWSGAFMRWYLGMVLVGGTMMVLLAPEFDVSGLHALMCCMVVPIAVGMAVAWWVGRD